MWVSVNRHVHVVITCLQKNYMTQLQGQQISGQFCDGSLLFQKEIGTKNQSDSRPQTSAMFIAILEAVKTAHVFNISCFLGLLYLQEI